MARRILPPLNGLRAFEAAARLGSFAASAEELGVTSGAVSQQVRGLENQMGVALFERRPQSLVPTTAARELLPVLTEALDAIAAVTRRLQAPAAEAAIPLRIACPSGFAALYLLPRLDRFNRRAPDISLILTATERLIELGDATSDAPFDACIRFGRAGWGGHLGCDFLFADRRIPVCSPKYLTAHPIVAGAADPLLGHTLLEALSAPDGWRDWRAAKGWPGGAARVLGFGDERLAVDAALSGLGIALSDRALVAEPIAAGRLVAPLEPQEMARGTAWFLVYRAADPLPPAIAAFRAWLLDEEV
jgi:LysR family glycine cleavage system transcriptional activator